MPVYYRRICHSDSNVRGCPLCRMELGVLAGVQKQATRDRIVVFSVNWKESAQRFQQIRHSLKDVRSRARDDAAYKQPPSAWAGLQGIVIDVRSISQVLASGPAASEPTVLGRRPRLYLAACNAEDMAMLVRQQNVETFLSCASHHEYLAGCGHRTAGLEDFRLLPRVQDRKRTQSTGRLRLRCKLQLGLLRSFLVHSHPDGSAVSLGG